MANKKIRYAVVGLGHIAQTAVLPAFRNASRNSQLMALVSGDLHKAAKIGQKQKIENVFSYSEYDELLESGLVDAVYICLPNHMHYEFSMKALSKGIHVLCEKPLALKEEECLELEKFAEEKKLKLMTAYRLHFDPANLKAIELVRKNKIGEPRYFSSQFSFSIKDRNNIRLRNETGGGPLWDIGVYCVNAARYLFQSEPEEVMAMTAAGKDQRFQEVEESAGVILKFPEERIATFAISYGAANAAHFQIYGAKGSLILENAYEYEVPRKLVLETERQRQTFRFSRLDQFSPEIMYFSDCVLKNRVIEPSGYEGAADVKVIEAIYESATKGRAVRISAEKEIEHKPSVREKQKYRKPPAPKVDTIGAKSPA